MSCSPTPGSCNSSNYSEYDCLYNTKNGSARTGSVITLDTSDKQKDYACYAHHSLEAKRTQLDPQIAELYNPPDSIRNVSETNFDATMLSGVLWVMLGTTAMYYAFTKI